MMFVNEPPSQNSQTYLNKQVQLPVVKRDSDGIGTDDTAAAATAATAESDSLTDDTVTVTVTADVVVGVSLYDNNSNDNDGDGDSDDRDGCDDRREKSVPINNIEWILLIAFIAQIANFSLWIAEITHASVECLVFPYDRPAAGVITVLVVWCSGGASLLYVQYRVGTANWSSVKRMTRKRTSLIIPLACTTVAVVVWQDTVIAGFIQMFIIIWGITLVEVIVVKPSVYIALAACFTMSYAHIALHSMRCEASLAERIVGITVVPIVIEGLRCVVWCWKTGKRKYFVHDHAFWKGHEGFTQSV
jgi:hypothetical protein